MTEHTPTPEHPEKPDLAFDRLRAADPAAAAEPDLVSLRSQVDARGDVVDELAARRRPRRGLQVAAAVAATALVATGGYLVGAGGQSSTSAASDVSPAASAAPPITLGQAHDQVAPSPEMSSESGRGAGMSSPTAGRGGAAGLYATADRAMLPWGSGRAVFTGSGLGSGPATAAAYGFDGSAIFTKDTLATLAEKLGVEGKVREDEWSLSIGPDDGSAASLMFYPEAGVSFTFSDPAKSVWFCEETTGSTEGDDPCGDRDLGKAPKGAALTDAAEDFLVLLGQDPAAFEIEVATTEESGQYAWVNAWPVVDGQRTQLSWSMSFTGAGIDNANGYLADRVALGEYPVISPDEAVARLNDSRFGTGDVTYPATWGEGLLQPAARGSSAGLPAAPGTGDKIAWALENVTLTSARLGLALYSTTGGAQVLVPAYQLGGDDGRTWSVIAVADSELDFSPAS